MRVYLAQEHNTMSPVRARTRSARSGVERTNHEATAPPTLTACAGIIFFREIFLFEKVMDRPTQTPQKFSKIMTKSYSKTSQEVTLTITMRDRNHELII